MTSTIPYQAPFFGSTAFNCPICSAFANQEWKKLNTSINGRFDTLRETIICICYHCHRYSIWYDEKMIYPDFSGIEPPNQDLNEDIKRDYQEAVSIMQKSPRGAAALLRLMIQKLMIQLGEKGKDINSDIGNLVKHGLPVKIQQSLDSLRVIGNEAVHPGQLDLKDDVLIVARLFKLVNFIADKTISELKEIDEIYHNEISESNRIQIKKRDGK